MKKQSFAVPAALLIAAMLSGCAASAAPVTESEEAVTEIRTDAVTQADNVRYTPGTYQGQGEGYTGPIHVSVTVDETSILSITVDEDQEGKLGLSVYEQLGAAMMQNNTSDVDAVSGASITSGGYKAAVRDALTKAKHS